MICTRLAGGLGNQLFQLAAAVAMRAEGQSKVYLGTAGLGSYRAQRSFDMAQLLDLPPWCVGGAAQAGEHKLADRLMTARIGRWLLGSGVSDRNFGVRLAAGRREPAARWLWLDGYFQQCWGWEEFGPVLSTMLPWVRTAAMEESPPAADCLIHVRGGDFLGSEVHRVVDVSFYVRALESMRLQRPTLRSAWVVTDDRAYAGPVLDALARAHPDVDLAFGTHATGGWLGDFALLRRAPARILGNSTFSWWAAALDSHHSLTLSPNQWTRGVPRRLFLPWEAVVPV